MERIELPLSRLSQAQKLDMLEKIWDDLTSEEKRFESPDWHEKVLREREEALSAGKVKISDWDEAKERIEQNLR